MKILLPKQKTSFFLRKNKLLVFKFKFPLIDFIVLLRLNANSESDCLKVIIEDRF